MKCQKNKACVKQPANALPDDRKRCSGCDKTGKDIVYTYDSVDVDPSQSATMIIVKLQQEGWKELQYVSNSSWGDCSSPEILGERPMTPKELKEHNKAKKKDKYTYEELEEALKASLELQSHYAKLLNMYDSGERITFPSIDKWIKRVKEMK